MFSPNSKLKNPQDIKTKGNSVSKKILLSEVPPPPLTEDDADSVRCGGNGEAPVNSRNKGGLSGMAKMLTKRVLSILSNLPLAIGEMFAIAALMALGMLSSPSLFLFQGG